MDISLIQQLVESRVKGKPQPMSEKQWTLQHQPTTFGQWRSWVGVIGNTIDDEVGLVFGDYAVVEGHKVPLRWGFEVYCLCCGRSDDDKWTPMHQKQLSKLIRSFVLKYSRGSGKTLMLAILGFTLMRWNGNYTWIHTAAIKDQAERVWAYLKKILDSNDFNDLLAKRTTKTTIEFKNGSESFIATGSEEGQNSKHPQLKTWDEVEFIDMKVVREGRLAGMQKRRRGGLRLPPVIVYCSTQKKPNETMFVLMAEAKKGKHRLLLGNLWDVIERCEDWRTESLVKGLKCSDWNEIILQIDQLDRLPKLGQEGEARLAGLRHSRKLLEQNCKLCEYCKGIAKKGSGHYSIDDAIDTTKDPNYFRAQMLCERPQMDGALYPLFSEADNVSDQAVFNPALPVVAFLDYGFTQDPSFLQLVHLRGPHVTMFYEEEILHKCAERTPAHLRATLDELGVDFGSVEFWAVDPSAVELIHHMRDDGFNVVLPQGKRQRRISYGVEKLTELIFDDGCRRLSIHPDCSMTIQCIMISEKGSDGNPKRGQYNHPEAALRYGSIQVARQHEGQSRIIFAGRRPGKSLRR
jgi:hypothetical protein